MFDKPFFTRDMGARLRELRRRHGLTQKEVAARIGLKPKGGRCQVYCLEAGLNPNPSLKLVTLYLRACGAKFAEFYDCLTATELEPVDTREIDRTGFPKPRRDILKQKTLRQVHKYRMRTEYPLKGKPLPPGKLKPAAEKFGQYRVRVNIIEEAVKQSLGEAKVKSAFYSAYLMLARQSLSVLRRHSGVKQTERLARLIAEAEAKGLDAKVAAQVRQVVARQLQLSASRCRRRPGVLSAAGPVG